jgi:peptidoglycan/xylan/chitin deacetylase (PgdA/CDA1 family)
MLLFPDMRASLTRHVAASLAPIVRRLPHARSGIRILMYHRVIDTPTFHQLAVPPNIFEEQLAALRPSGYEPVSLGVALDALAGRQQIRLPAVVVTLDDGTMDHYTTALPILERHRVPATLYLVTDFLEGRSRDPGVRGPFLGRDQVREMAGRGMSFGVHGRTHRELPSLSEAEAWHEISTARAILQETLGAPLDTFSYPRGAFTSAHAALTERAGFRAAVTTVPGVNGPGADLFRLCRTQMTSRDRGAALRHKLDGAYDALHTLLLRSRRLVGRRAPLAPPLPSSQPLAP